MKSETNFCPRCGKPVWRSPADAIHTCSPPDKTRESSHWEGCWNTRGHHECAIGADHFAGAGKPIGEKA